MTVLGAIGFDEYRCCVLSGNGYRIDVSASGGDEDVEGLLTGDRSLIVALRRTELLLLERLL